MPTLSEAILAHARELPEGQPLVARKLAGFGSAKRVGRVLSQLTARGRLVRAGRGTYVRTVEGRFGTRAPSAAKVAQAIAASRGEIIASHGAMAANSLGLTTQVPVRNVFLTSGRSRTIEIGSQAVEMRHAPSWQLSQATSPAGQVVRALAWLGPEKAAEAVETLKRRIPTSDLVEVSTMAGRLPGWLAHQVRAFA